MPPDIQGENCTILTHKKQALQRLQIEETNMTKTKWDRHEILAALRRNSMTLGGIAEHYSLAPSSMRNIWSRPNEKAERAIAHFLDVAVEELFPDRYPKNANRILKQLQQPRQVRPVSEKPEDAKLGKAA